LIPGALGANDLRSNILNCRNRCEVLRAWEDPAMADKAPDPVVQILEKAIGRVAAKDASLRGSKAARWLVITEHEWAEGGSTLSVFRSEAQPPWDTLGLLGFATAIETERAASHYRDPS
jgi:hypothetical protein